MIPGITDSESIAHMIQVAIAPVFLLNGLGILLNVFTGRLARVVDRMRIAGNHLRANTDIARMPQLQRELAYQRRRLKIVNAAIALVAFSAFLTCCAILALFVAGIDRTSQSPLPLGLFAAAVIAVILALGLFIAEVRVSGKALAAETDDLKA
ncbi:MAG: DUF2721 domain-containing protein [Proteobacteria bacterium]|nr:DUF2721 domain-containing protein [Pseudomonadota bacterium]